MIGIKPRFIDAVNMNIKMKTSDFEICNTSIQKSLQWQLINTKLMGIVILVLVIRTSCYQKQYNSKSHLVTKKALLVIRNSLLSGYLLTSCHCISKIHGFVFQSMNHLLISQ